MLSYPRTRTRSQGHGGPESVNAPVAGAFKHKGSQETVFGSELGLVFVKVSSLEYSSTLKSGRHSCYSDRDSVAYLAGASFLQDLNPLRLCS